jgi:zinc/manganese transport system substrate-binding protein
MSTIALAGCGEGSSEHGLTVVAAESFWGSIAAQLAGTRATVHSLIVNPAQDPHDYEPTAADARWLASAQLVIENGLGYDPWVQRLLNANQTGALITVNVGKLFGLKEGENPHRWYDPGDVGQLARAITADLESLDPHGAAYFDRQLQHFEGSALATYHELIASIRAKYAGTPVGASESIFALLSPALGLHLITPPSFMKAISEGTDLSAQDTETAQRQIARHEIKVWIYNSQNATPAIQHLNALARENHIPIATVTETLTPAGASFEQWQVAQLQELERALRSASSR